MDSSEKIEHLISLVDDAVDTIKDYLMGDLDYMEIRDTMRRTMKRLERGLADVK
ncbi:hypothetical protein [Sphingobium sp. IP1]|uniref:hypothetical protein n=1 Tax=Sphingobium sp. IP1 TaxID=2021637 RepID=UPI001C558513|nr:hypothetical protein [Sphingobium sp. IP1]